MQTGSLKYRVLGLTAALLLVLSGCSMPSFTTGTESSGTDTGKTSEITVIPTYTPTPVSYREPTVTDVTGEAGSIHPTFSGAFEDIWLSAAEIPVKNALVSKDEISATVRILWSESMLFVQVHVLDTTPDTESGNINSEDDVWFFLNESAELPQKYAVGDAYYVVNRDGVATYGTGADSANFIYCTYEDGDSGYYVEAGIPFTSITAKAGRVIGFDVRVNNAKNQSLRTSLQLADKSGYTEYTLQGVCKITLE